MKLKEFIFRHFVCRHGKKQIVSVNTHLVSAGMRKVKETKYRCPDCGKEWAEEDY